MIELYGNDLLSGRQYHGRINCTHEDLYGYCWWGVQLLT